jgi:hypothetical protein
MSDSYQAIVDLEATPGDAEALARRVVERLSVEGLIMPSLDPGAVLGGSGGYRPGRRICELYRGSPADLYFLTLVANGMEVNTGQWVNELGFLFVEDYTCPRCAAQFPEDHAVAEQFYDAVSQFYGGVSRPVITCPRCLIGSAVQEWRSSNHLGFAHLAFGFWNWPPLDSAAWAVDIPRLLSEVLGHEVVLTQGRL